ncbi:uncharacterized protein [Nicotiana sylvestris]|uniref:uncharacterized protein n=1 Tax=Nicotiana sylvestris TaxID=4096 RepID=UPI00388C99E4
MARESRPTETFVLVPIEIDDSTGLNEVNIPLIDALKEMSGYAKMMKDLMYRKLDFQDLATVTLAQTCSVVVTRLTTEKLSNPGSFTIPCTIGNNAYAKVLCDLGASINLMPLAIYKSLGIGRARPISMLLQLDNRIVKRHFGILDDVLVQVEKFVFPADFVILDCRVDEEIPIILGRPFLVEQLLQVLMVCKTTIGWTISDIKSISPAFCMHKILLEDGHKPSREHQRRLNPNMKEVVKKEVSKWLDAEIIFPISDSNWEGIVSGHLVSSKGIKVDRAKVDVIEKLPPPTSVKIIRSILRHAGFYRIFINDFSKISNILCKLLEKDYPFVFFDDCMVAFEELKKRLVTTPIMVAPDWEQPFELMYDASDYAVGAVIGQRKDKIMHPIYYASRTLSDAQLNYTVTEKEILAVVFAFGQFRPYLIGSKIIVYIDHAALMYLMEKKESKSRLIRWVLLLQEFDLEIREQKRTENQVADLGWREPRKRLRWKRLWRLSWMNNY